MSPGSFYDSGPIIRSGGSVTVADGPRRPLSRSRDVAFREELASPFEIKLAPGVRKQIEEEVHWCGPGGGGFSDRKRRETGGLLFARACPHVRVDDVELAIASGPGPDSGHAEAAFLRGAVERIERQVFATRPRTLYRLAGSWHSHPDPDDHPSQTDLQSWAANYFKIETPDHIALIVTPSDLSGWMFPRISGYVLRSNYSGGGYVCERAQVVEI
jgi:hypothetical protein